MSRRVVAGAFGLAFASGLAGCAQDRSALTRSGPAIGVDAPMRSIYDQINGDNPGVTPQSIADGRPPQFASERLAQGGAAAPATSDPAASQASATLGDPTATAEPVAAQASAGRPSPYVRQAGSPRPQVARIPTVSNAPPPEMAAATPAAASAAPAFDPYPIDPATNPASAPPAVSAAPAPAEAPAPVAATVVSPPPPSDQPDGAPAVVADPVRPPAAAAPAAPATAVPSNDPLLGAEPDVMPAIVMPPAAAAPAEAPAPVEPSAAPAPVADPLASPASAALPSGPAVAEPVVMPPSAAPVPHPGPAAAMPPPARLKGDPVLGTDPEVTPEFGIRPGRMAPIDPLPAGDVGLPPTVRDMPANATSPSAPFVTADDPAANPPAIPGAGPAAPATPPPGAFPAPRPTPPGDPLLGAEPDVMPAIVMPPPAARPQAPGVGPGASNLSPIRADAPGVVVRASSAPLDEPAPSAGSAPARAEVTDPTAVRLSVGGRSAYEAGKAVAGVGEDVITLREWTAAVDKRRKAIPIDQPLPSDQRYMLVRSVLFEMVDRLLIFQEARRVLKDPKKYKEMEQYADKWWTDNELPPLLRQTASADLLDLKRKMAERNESLDEVREQFRREFISQGYIESRLAPKMKVELLEMRKYYTDNLSQFELPAKTCWREVLVEVKGGDRDKAKQRAEALLARLSRGEDFATLAKAESDGPTKGQGGFWELTPGSYGVEAVRDALAALPVGRVSGVLEGPDSFHVVVVESRREAGPADFRDVQDKIRETLKREKIDRESAAYIAKLRRQSVIWTVLDKDPPIGPTASTTGRSR